MKSKKFRVVGVVPTAKQASTPAAASSSGTQALLAAAAELQRLLEEPIDPRGNRVRRLVKSEVADVIGLSHAELASLARSLPPERLLALVQGLASELRRLNLLLADGPDQLNGPNATHDLTHGEQLSKILEVGGAEMLRHDVLRARHEVELALAIAVEEHERRVNAAKYNDGNITLSRGGPRNLDQLEIWGRQQANIAARLRHAPDDDAGRGALGVSKAGQEHEADIRKAARSPLPSDSWTGSNAPLLRRPKL